LEERIWFITALDHAHYSRIVLAAWVMVFVVVGYFVLYYSFFIL